MVNRKYHYGQGPIRRFVFYDEWSHGGDWFGDWEIVRDFLLSQKYIMTKEEIIDFEDYCDCAPDDLEPTAPTNEDEPF